MAIPKEPNKITEPFGFVGGKMLQDILNKMPDAITEDEREILRARITYLTPEQIKNYGLKEKEEEKVPTPPDTPKEETAKEKKAREKAEKAAAKAAKKK